MFLGGTFDDAGGAQDGFGAFDNLTGNDAVFQIVREEISAFLSGVASAEDCAAKIQSRASIWLAERK